MKALVLAAGYATRLRPLTDMKAKPLLELGGRPMVDYVCDRIDEVAEVDELHLVSNARFATDFERWAAGREGRLVPRVHDDGSRSNGERLGAIADVRFVVERAGLAGETLLVIAGDNLFEFSLAAMVEFWRAQAEREGRPTSCVAVHRLADRDRVPLYGVVTLDPSERVIEFVEKPRLPKSDLIATACYVFAPEHVAMIDRYLEQGNSPDQPGNLVAWLHALEPVYGFAFGGMWLDIGDREQLREADEIIRLRASS